MMRTSEIQDKGCQAVRALVSGCSPVHGMGLNNADFAAVPDFTMPPRISATGCFSEAKFALLALSLNDFSPAQLPHPSRGLLHTLFVVYRLPGQLAPNCPV
jgi:hypothetical protein